MTTVGIVSPGYMGAGLGWALRTGGARVVATLDGRSARTGRLAAEAGVDLLPTLVDVVGAADVVLSVTPPGRALAASESIADACRRSGARRSWPISTPSPRPTMAAMARVLDGLPVVDGSISGAPPTHTPGARVYLSGPRADEVAALPWAGKVEPIVVGDGIGTASALKMCTASVYKGLDRAADAGDAHGRAARRPRSRPRRPRAQRPGPLRRGWPAPRRRRTGSSTRCGRSPPPRPARDSRRHCSRPSPTCTRTSRAPRSPTATRRRPGRRPAEIVARLAGPPPEPPGRVLTPTTVAASPTVTAISSPSRAPRCQLQVVAAPEPARVVPAGVAPGRQQAHRLVGHGEHLRAVDGLQFALGHVGGRVDRRPSRPAPTTRQLPAGAAQPPPAQLRGRRERRAVQARDRAQHGVVHVAGGRRVELPQPRALPVPGRPDRDRGAQVVQLHAALVLAGPHVGQRPAQLGVPHQRRQVVERSRPCRRG